ncbi:MAG TPA: ornithine cyclodeaminase family protein, partial [Candidatus Scatomorpha pullicola]|nr:ornithine cyclodeaminase family protein [Candidatus Scatomorpha pullicola]
FGDDAGQCFAVGECEIPHREGVLDALTAEIGDVILGRAPGRVSNEDITVFDSTGIALQDLASGAVILERARELDVGLVTEL